MAVEVFTVDLNKPIVFQVGHLGEAYQEWVHRPIPSKEGLRFFANDFLESLTHNKWWFVPLGWLPVVYWFISKSAMKLGGHSKVAPMVVYGLCVWTAFEYALHRFLFHMKTKTYWGNTAHFLLHGFHHKQPMDGLRLVTPPAAVALSCFPFYGLARLLASPAAAPALFGGWLLGYVIYDTTHYFLHHGEPSKIQALKNFQKYHLKHHRFNMGFGITSPFWDKVFRTLPTLKSSRDGMSMKIVDIVQVKT